MFAAEMRAEPVRGAASTTPSFPHARQQFLAALRELLADRSIPGRDRIDEAMATIAAVSQMVVLSELQERAT